MADIGNMTTQADIEMKMGADTNTSSFTTTSMALSAAQAEGIINAASRFNITNAITTGTLTGSHYTGIFNNIVSSLVAIDAIKFDMSDINRIEAEDRINILRDSTLRDLSIIRDIKTQEWMSLK